MRIGYLTSQYPAPSHTFIRREVEAMRVLGADIATFSIRPTGPGWLDAPEEAAAAAATYYVLPPSIGPWSIALLQQIMGRPLRMLQTFALALKHRPPGLRGFGLALAHFGEAIVLAQELQRREITHLHNHFANSAATVGMLAAHQSKITWSFTIHGISEFDYPAGLTLPAKIARATFAACVSYFGKAQASRVVPPADWSKLHVVRCGLLLDELPAAEGREQGTLHLIAVGRLSPEKGYSGLFEALAALATDRPWRLSVVGDGPMAASLRDEVVVRGLSDRIEFRGRLTESETLRAIADADALVLPSFMEGLPVVLMEALALGKPVIASRVAGIPELIEEGFNGLLFAPSDWAELSVKLSELVDDPALRERLGSAGPKRIAEEFDVRLSAMKLFSLFGLDAPSEPNFSALPAAPVPRTSATSRARSPAS